jgi:hypothetical protein
VIVLSADIRLALGIPFSRGSSRSATTSFPRGPALGMRDGASRYLVASHPLFHALQQNRRSGAGMATPPGEPDSSF